MTQIHDPNSLSAVLPSDPTFRSEKFDSSKAAAYAAHRQTYPKALIDTILDLHKSSGGATNLLLDVGCGPGNATRLLAPYFQHAIGVDPGQSMIETAQSGSLPPCRTASGEHTKFKVCSAEELASVIDPESIDIITVGTAAHWFNMPKFYTAAAKVLKPGGSIAIWCGGHHFADPGTTPNAPEVQKVWDSVEYDVLGPYMMPGNILCRDLYRDMEMPWTVRTDDTAMGNALSKFDETRSKRLEFNADGQPDPRFSDTHGFIWHEMVTLGQLVKILGTASPIIRWREAHKEQLEKGEIEDVAEKYFRNMTAEALGSETEKFGVGISMGLIWIKKKS